MPHRALKIVALSAILALATSACTSSSSPAAPFALPSSPPASEVAAIEAVVLDYFEGWFDGDVDRITRAMHPELAKRTLATDATGTELLRSTTAAPMIDATARGVGRTRDLPDRQIRIQVVEVYEPMASVIVRSAVYREYLHLVHTREGWKIVNALWKRTE